MTRPDQPRRELSMLGAMVLAVLITSGCLVVAVLVLNFVVIRK
jgi:hypothetical protein